MTDPTEELEGGGGPGLGLDPPEAAAPAQAVEATGAGPAYQVLARKYRPTTFADLIGQEAMVRTLSNAFAADRIAHAFILTGVRGVGKTTTARILAKGFNCVGPDGTGGPTTEPCGVCEFCTAIAESRHVDVLEMDAASRTGVADVREIIDAVRYRAASARYKVYIIDEIHMLSTNAFNALLKTLEEPPEHVKFIFATTEIRKVPVTVLSRCQRFDLRRVEPEALIAHLARICEAEGAQVAADALALIARAAEGSVRDALSLLDQAIAHGAGETSADQVRAMLGLADRGLTLDLFEAVMAGDCAGALASFSEQHAQGADPLAVLRDLAEITHWISMAKVRPSAAEDPTLGPDAQARGRALGERLGMRALTRAWQMLLKAMEEAAAAPNPAAAAEMAIIRLTHVADLPTPEEIVRRLEGPGAGAASSQGPPRAASSGGSGRSGASAAAVATAPSAGAPAPPSGAPTAVSRVETRAGGASAARAAPALSVVAQAAPEPLREPEPSPEPARSPEPASEPEAELPEALRPYPDFDAVVALIRAKRDMALLVEVENSLRLVSYAPGRISFAPAPGAPTALASDLGRKLSGWTGARWMVSVEAGAEGAPTLAETRRAAQEDLEARLREHPLVRAALEAFPGAEIRAARGAEDLAAAAAFEAEAAAPEEAPDTNDDDWADWDPVDPYDAR
ncbi:MAG: DNA polymerase III subunit gamma/tau [Pseudomonadota bacterium]